ncbi:ribonuclease H-like domain-containing protein [Tanacetum coccineum]
MVSELLERASMLTCNPCRTPVDTDSKLSADGDPVSDPTLYRSLARALQYLTFTLPDISYAVHYFRPHNLLWLLILMQIGLAAPRTHRLTPLFCVFLGNNHFRVLSNRQVTLSRSMLKLISGVAKPLLKLVWLHNLLRSFIHHLSNRNTVYCDNVMPFTLF